MGWVNAGRPPRTGNPSGPRSRLVRGHSGTKFVRRVAACTHEVPVPLHGSFRNACPGRAVFLCMTSVEQCWMLKNNDCERRESRDADELSNVRC